MEFRLLGPLELEGRNGVVPLGSGKQRALLAVLLLHANEPVSRERLIDELWGSEPPASAAHSVEVYISRLRKTLNGAGLEGVLTSRGTGYLLRVDREHCDLGRFQRLLEESRTADATRARALLGEALALWRGPALADVDLPGSERSAVERLEELRLEALEERIERDLELNQHGAVVAELQVLVRANPLRERLRGQHMRALYGSGRQAEALESYREAHRALGELGLEPSPELKVLQRQILSHDASLSPSRETAAPERPLARRRAFAAAAATILLVGGALAFTIGSTRNSGAAPRAVEPVMNSVGLVDPKRHRLVADIPIGGRLTIGPGRPSLAAGLGSVWVCDADDKTLVRIDPTTRRVVRTIGLGVTPASVVVGHGAVWVEATPTTQVIELDRLGNIVRRIRLVRRDPFPPVGDHSSASLASGPDAIWAIHGLASLAKIDPRTGRVIRDIVGLGGILPRQVLATADAVWVTAPPDGLAVRIDPRTGVLLQRTAARGANLAYWSGLTGGRDGVWVADSANDEVLRINGAASDPNATVPVDHGPTGMLWRDGSIWVAASLDGTIDEVDPDTLRVVSRTHVGSSPVDLVAGPGEMIWVTFADTWASAP
jgi:DNA-binding SARP family transcriptional activator/streptogramin lyase